MAAGDDLKRDEFKRKAKEMAEKARAAAQREKARGGGTTGERAEGGGTGTARRDDARESGSGRR
ncbi:hypothetical protein [Streptomyces sp. ICBB 8177]|uniref:hypothetical protein n=1 Tax=Streptomyces sp. ICBB 8177 TaxID=563922 RepID=UPI000D67DF9C|nr:hypothetical protein [Streptomyces sp. ICBB 8177]PWI40992.1 hypothetical protein CK485_26765 [Streptomyces sp. ICBB 8177]